MYLPEKISTTIRVIEKKALFFASGSRILYDQLPWLGGGMQGRSQGEGSRGSGTPSRAQEPPLPARSPFFNSDFIPARV